MIVDEITEETTATAHHEAPQQHGAAGAAQSMSSPPKAGSQRPRAEQQSPTDAPPRAYSRLSDDDVLDYASDGAAGAAGAPATTNALEKMMDAAASAPIPAISVAAKKKKDKAASKAEKAELRKAAAARKKAPPHQPGTAGAAPQPTMRQEEIAPPPEMPPITEETPVDQPLPPGQLDPVAFPPLQVPMAAHLAHTSNVLDRLSQQVRHPASDRASTVTSAMPSRMMSPRVETQGFQVQQPAPPHQHRPRARTHAAARCAMMLLMMHDLNLHASLAWRGGASRCTRGPGLSLVLPLKRHKSYRGSCLQALPLDSETLRSFWNETAQGCQNSNDVHLLLRMHPEMATRMRVTPDAVLFDVPMLYTALRMEHPNIAVLDMDQVYQGGYTAYQAAEQSQAGHDLCTGEPLTAEGVMWMGAEAFAHCRSTHAALKLRPTPPSDLRLPEGFTGVTGVGQPKEGVASVTLRDGTMLPRDEGDLVDAMEVNKQFIKRLNDHIGVKGLGAHPRARPSVHFLECYSLKLAHRLMEIWWENMKAESGTHTEPSNPEPMRSTNPTDTPCPPEQRIHPVEDVAASETAATDTREARFRIQKRQPVARPAAGTKGSQTPGDRGTPPERARFTPASLTRAKGPNARPEVTSQTAVRAPNAPLQPPSGPPGNPLSFAEVPDDWEDVAAMEPPSANPPAPVTADIELTEAPPPAAEVKTYKEVDIAHAIITNRLNTRVVPADMMAVHFGEEISEKEEVPGMSDVLTAVCLAFSKETGKPDETGPWMVAAPRRAIEIGTELKTFMVWFEDGTSAQYSIKPCTDDGRPLLSTRSTYASQGSSDFNITVILNLPRWCLGRSLKLGHLDFVKDTVHEALKTYAPAVKTNLTQAETPELGMTKGSLFLFFYPKDVAQYDEVKVALRAFKRFPIVLEGKDVEPVRAFIPREVLAKLGLRQCCHRPPGECDEEKLMEGIAQNSYCSWVTSCDEQMGYSQRARGVVAEAESPMVKRKREQDASHRTKVANRASVQAMRIQGIKATLCTKFATGKVGTHPPACDKPKRIHLTHTQPSAVHTANGSATARLPAPPLRAPGVDQTAHRVPVSHGGVLLLQGGGLPLWEARELCDAHAAVDTMDAFPARPGYDSSATWGESRARIPLPSRRGTGGRDRIREAQQDRHERGEREDVRMRGMWIHGRLDECLQEGSRRREAPHRAGGRMHVEGMLQQRRQTVPRGTAHCKPVREARGPGSGDAHAGSPAAGHPRHEGAHSRREEHQQDGQTSMQAAPRTDSRARGSANSDAHRHLVTSHPTAYHWHTTNILWIRGRLPWIITRRHA